MSGGSYGYAYSHLDELEMWVGTLQNMAKDCRQWSTNTHTKYVRALPLIEANKVPVTLEDRAMILVRALLLERGAERLRLAVEEVKALRGIMEEVEYLASGDSLVDDLMTKLPVGGA